MGVFDMAQRNMQASQFKKADKEQQALFVSMVEALDQQNNVSMTQVNLLRRQVDLLEALFSKIDSIERKVERIEAHTSGVEALRSNI